MNVSIVSYIEVGGIKIEKNMKCDIKMLSGSVLRNATIGFEETMEIISDGNSSLVVQNKGITSYSNDDEFIIDVDEIDSIIPRKD